MAIFDKILRKKAQSKFITEEEYIFNLEIQTKLSPKTLEQLRELGVDDSSELRIEFFFYTDKEEKAMKLAENLKDKEYEVSYGASASDKKLLVITGLTKPMKMDEETVMGWTREMCTLGYNHDCEFDGWGTNPKQ